MHKFISFLVVICFALCNPSITGAAQTIDRPNIVVIYADDLGYGDVSCYNKERGKITTPHIDRLAAEGMGFTDGHSSSGVCSPSRYTLLTGRYHWRSRLQSGIVRLWGGPVIASDRLTVAGLLSQAGYRTSCIGKWHLGWNWPIPAKEKNLFRSPGRKKDVTATDAHRNAWRKAFSQPIAGGPATRGFDSYFGTDVPDWPPFCFIENDRTIGIPSEFLPALLVKNNQASDRGPALAGWKFEPILPMLGERAGQFIENAAKGSEPFFLYMPLTSPHTPLAVNPQWKGKSGLNTYADFVMETDAVVGKVLAALEKSGAAGRTLVLFTSDNGCAPYIGADELEKKGHYPSGPLRGYKSDVWEGGHRVPFIVRWPGVVKAKSISHQLVHQADLMATFADIIGASLPENAGEDSFSFLPLLKGNESPIREHAISQSFRGLLSVRRGKWKLIAGRGSGGWTKGQDEHRVFLYGTEPLKGSGGWTKGQDEHPGQLYDLEEDLAEKNNLWIKKSAITGELIALLEKLVTNGRSTNGSARKNDVPVKWRRFLSK